MTHIDEPSRPPAKLWRETHHPCGDIQSFDHIPGMITPAEERYLYWLTSQQYTGRGAVVEVGTRLGRSTVFLASGLRDSGRCGRLHCVDRFVWQSSMTGKADLDLRPGDDFQPHFERNVRPLFPDLEVTRREAGEIAWDGGPIEILFIDGPKRLPQISDALAAFGPALQPGVSRVVFQDYLHFPSYALAMMLSCLDDRLAIEHAVDEAYTVTFRVTGSMDLRDAQPVELNFLTWPADAALARWRAIMDQLPAGPRSMLEPGGAMLLYDLGEPERARQYLLDLDMSRWPRDKWIDLRRQRSLYQRYEPLFRALGIEPTQPADDADDRRASSEADDLQTEPTSGVRTLGDRLRRVFGLKG